MSAFPKSGRSDGPIITNMTVRFRPLADIPALLVLDAGLLSTYIGYRHPMRLAKEPLHLATWQLRLQVFLEVVPNGLPPICLAAA